MGIEQKTFLGLSLTMSLGYFDVVSTYMLVYMTSNSLKDSLYEFNGELTIDYIMEKLNRRAYNRHNYFNILFHTYKFSTKQFCKLVVSIIIQKPYLKKTIEMDHDPWVEVDKSLDIPKSSLNYNNVVIIMSCWVGSTHILSKELGYQRYISQIIAFGECKVYIQGLMTYVCEYIKKNKVYEVPTLKLHALNVSNFEVCSLYEMKYSENQPNRIYYNSTPLKHSPFGSQLILHWNETYRWYPSISNTGLVIGMEICERVNEIRIIFQVRLHDKKKCKAYDRIFKLRRRTNWEKTYCTYPNITIFHFLEVLLGWK